MNKPGSIFLTSTGLSGEGVYKKFKEVVDLNSFKKAVIITTAASGKENNKYSQLALSQLKSAGMVSVDFYDFEKDGAKSLSRYDVIYVCGGNTFALMKFARAANFAGEIRSLLNRGGIYIGVSAGSLIVGPTIEIAGEINPDKNEVGVKDFRGYNIVDFIVFPHYEEKYEKSIRRAEKKYKQKIRRLRNGEFIFIDENEPGSEADFRKYIKPLEDCSRSEAGTKGYNLKIISEIRGVKIPKTLCISSELFNLIVKTDSSREGNLNFELPPAFSGAVLREVHNCFGDAKLVVRSSATCEDSPFLSFAGNYFSFLNIRGRKKILHAIRECYLSMLNKNSQIYASFFSLDIRVHAMAILIQEVAPVVMSGVMFTKNPVRRDGNIIIEYGGGLGDKVVGGTAVPKTKEINLKNKRNDPEFMVRLASIGKKIERKFKNPQDIEWGMLKDKTLVFFQSRPITTLSNKKNNSSGQAIDVAKTSVAAKGIGGSGGVARGMLFCGGNKKKMSIKESAILYFGKTVNLEFLQHLSNVKGIIIAGGILSHIAVIARELGIPLAAGVKNFDKNNKNLIIIDGNRGLIYYDKK